MKPPVKHKRLNPKKRPELAKLAEKVGQFIEYWGFKSVQGRLWLYLYVSSQPLSSIELSHLLGISPALVTQCVQVLLEYRVILSAPKGVNGVLMYQANPQVAEAIRHVLVSRETQMLSETEEQLRKTHQESLHSKDQDLQVDMSKFGRIAEWINLFQMLLNFGIVSLSGSDTPFSEPKVFINRAKDLDLTTRKTPKTGPK